MTNYKMTNEFGEEIKAKPVYRKCRGIFWKTTAGEWIKKVVAIRNGVELTGEKKMIETTGIWQLIPA